MFGAVPETLMALPLCIAILSDWNKKLIDLGSLVTSAILEPKSLMNLRPIWPQDAIMSMRKCKYIRSAAIGVNKP